MPVIQNDPVLVFLVLALLAVPYLPQTEALCGGAAAAMVFRFLGDTHADVQQFEPLVDRKAGGIADTVLIEAIRARGWSAERIEGSLESIRGHLAGNQPLILLLEDRPSRYHYVVVVGADDTHVVIHDPTWGPARAIGIDELMHRWEPTRFWALLVTKENGQVSRYTPQPLRPSPSRRSNERCDRLLNDALDQIQLHGSEIAAPTLDAVSRACPDASAPRRELAGVRFSQRQFDAAARLAESAVERDASDSYAWDVLASSRFMLDNSWGALDAWNHVGKPIVDSLSISGLTRTRYALIAQYAGITPNTVLTPDRLTLAEHRLRELPDRTTTAIRYRPDQDGFATVTATIVERQRTPQTPIDWTLIGAQAAIDREVTLAVPGTTGQGELWQATWRWWANRPRAGLSFAAPRIGHFGGIWRVGGSWEEQTYRPPASGGSADIRQTQASGGISFSNWLPANLRVELSSGLDVWHVDGNARNVAHRLSAIRLGGAIEQRVMRDRGSIYAAATQWWPAAASTFHSLSVAGTLRSSAERRGLRGIVSAHLDAASTSAPLALWFGAGEGRGRPTLLRAHPLLDEGVIDGSAFGRRLQSATAEAQWWLAQPILPRIAIAAFMDAANAADRLNPAVGRAFQVDAGAGLRVHLPGSDRVVRVDYAHGLNDPRAHAVTIAFNAID